MELVFLYMEKLISEVQSSDQCILTLVSDDFFKLNVRIVRKALALE